MSKVNEFPGDEINRQLQNMNRNIQVALYSRTQLRSSMAFAQQLANQTAKMINPIQLSVAAQAAAEIERVTAIAGLDSFRSIVYGYQLPNIAAQVSSQFLDTLNQISQDNIRLAADASRIREVMSQQVFMSQSALSSLSFLSSKQFVESLSLNLKQALPLIGNEQLKEGIKTAEDLRNAAQQIDWDELIKSREHEDAEDKTGIEKSTLQEDIPTQHEELKLHLLLLQIQEKIIWLWNKSKDVKDDWENAVFWLVVLKGLLDLLQLAASQIHINGK